MAITVRERPPLDLHAEVQLPDGHLINLRSGDDDPGNRPQNIGFSTARWDGFKVGGCSFARRIDRAFTDLRLFNLLRFIDPSGDIAWEGRMAGLPRSTGNPPMWTVQAAGLMANARDRKFAMPFVDRAPGNWTSASVARRHVMAIAAVQQGIIDGSATAGGLEWLIPNQSIPDESTGELVYSAPAGCQIAKFGYKGKRTGLFTGFETPTIFVGDDDAFTVGGSSTALTLDDALHTATLGTPARYGLLRAYVSAGPVTPASHVQSYSKVAVYGSHGLTTYAIDDEPDGVLASDVITWLIENYCPQLNAGGVQATTYPIGHLAFHDRTFPYDAFLTVNSFHRWGLECWEGGAVHFAPLDLTDYDWELRLDDFGTALDVSGAVAEEVANGIEVTYTDASTGTTTTLLPDDHSELRDTNPLNPVNRAGLYRPTDIALSSPFSQADALQIGRAALAEFNAPKHKGTATRQGYIKDRAGNDQPVSKVRSGQRVLITDSIDEEVHVVHETDYQHDRHEVKIAVDDTFQRVDAYLDRYANAQRARGNE